VKKIPKVVILGAGMSAIACAENLSDSFQVKLYEKSRGVGGRLSAKRFLQTKFHFGAQFCTSRNPVFEEFLKRNGAKRFIGSAFDCATGSEVSTANYFIHPNGMHSLLKESAKQLSISFEDKCMEVDDQNNIAHFESGLKVPFDILISSLPLPQSQEILNFSVIPEVIFEPCIAVGLIVNFSKTVGHNAYKSIDENIAWAGSSKFFNSEMDETWVIQLSPETSKKMLGEQDAALIKLASEGMQELLGQEITVQDSSIFKWKYAQCSRSNTDQKYVQLKNNIFAIGDWNISPRIESAFLSGKKLADDLVSNDL